jgi:uncharacterized membrane protein YgcG
MAKRGWTARIPIWVRWTTRIPIWVRVSGTIALVLVGVLVSTMLLGAAGDGGSPGRSGDHAQMPGGGHGSGGGGSHGSGGGGGHGPATTGR